MTHALFAVLVLAQAPPPGSLAAIEGRVVNALTGEPLNKAQLVLRPEGGSRTPGAARSDAGGAFVLEGLAPGRYRLTAQRNGFVSTEYGAGGARRSGTAITLAAGQRLRDLTFKLTPHAVVTGRIVDEDGDPVVHAQVEVRRFGYVQGRRRLMPAGGANTNDLGEYRIHGLAPGRYYISANHRLRSMAMMGGTLRVSGSEPGEQVYGITYYPGSTDPASAVMVSVGAGAQFRADMTLLRRPAVRVSGRLANLPAVRSGRNAVVHLASVDEFRIQRTSTTVQDAEGRFELHGVLPGSYVLAADWFEERKRLSARKRIEVGAADLEEINLVLAPGGEVTGRIQVEGTAELALGRMHLNLVPMGESLTMGGMGARINKDGSFKLDNAAPERYSVILAPLPENCYLKSVRVGEEEALETGLDLSRGGSVGPVTVVVSANGGQVEGVGVGQDQQPAPGATVVLVPDTQRREHSHLYKTAIADQYGRFSMKGIAPGDYKLFAWDHVERGAYQDPEFLKPVEDRGEAITIRENSRETAQLKVIAEEGQ